MFFIGACYWRTWGEWSSGEWAYTKRRPPDFSNQDVQIEELNKNNLLIKICVKFITVYYMWITHEENLINYYSVLKFLLIYSEENLTICTLSHFTICIGDTIYIQQVLTIIGWWGTVEYWTKKKGARLYSIKLLHEVNRERIQRTKVRDGGKAMDVKQHPACAWVSATWDTARVATTSMSLLQHILGCCPTNLEFLPVNIRSSSSITTFKTLLKTYLFSMSFV